MGTAGKRVRRATNGDGPPSVTTNIIDATGPGQVVERERATLADSPLPDLCPEEHPAKQKQPDPAPQA